MTPEISTQSCRYCSLPFSSDDAVATHSYWQGIKFVSHKTCKMAGEKAEALECQTIDADCNDCKHFKRGEIVPHKADTIEKIRLGLVPNFSTEMWSGHCLKFDKPTIAYPKKWTGHKCFEHRRCEQPICK